MKDAQTQNQFVELRAQGWSFARIAQELKVGKATLVEWSRKFEHQIHNLRVIQLEELQEKYLASREARLESLGRQLKNVEAELAKRDLSTLPTGRLFVLSAMLRREISQETSSLRFSVPEEEIPEQEQIHSWHEWEP